MHKFVVSSGPRLCKSFMASDHIAARRLFVAWARSQVAPCDLDKVAVVDVDISGFGKSLAPSVDDTNLLYKEITGHNYVPSESVWARIPRSELDKVHSIWCRRAGDVKHGDT